MKMRKPLIFKGQSAVSETLANHLGKLDGWEKPEIVERQDDFRAVLLRQMPNLLFIDYDAHGQAPFGTLKAMPKQPPVILLSQSDSAAMPALECGATDLLVSPLSFPRLQQAIEKAISQPVSVHQEPEKKCLKSRGYFFVKSGYKIVKVMVNDILFIEGMREYVCIHTPNERIVTLQALGKFEALLPADRFVRVHRSYIANIDHINSIEGNRISIGNAHISISKRRREEFLQLINTDGLF